MINLKKYIFFILYKIINNNGTKYKIKKIIFK